jgi:hypothetical protein
VKSVKSVVLFLRLRRPAPANWFSQRHIGWGRA